MPGRAPAMVGDGREPRPWPRPCPRLWPRPPRMSLWSGRPGKGGVMYGKKEWGTREGGSPGAFGERALMSLGFGLASLGLVRLRGFSSWCSCDEGVGVCAGVWAVWAAEFCESCASWADADIHAGTCGGRENIRRYFAPS